MAFIDLTYEVSRRPQWNTFLAGLAIDVVGTLVLIAIASHPSNRVPLQTIASTDHVTWVAHITVPPMHATLPRTIPVPAHVSPKPEISKLVPPVTAQVKPPEPPKIGPPKPELPKIAAAAPPVELSHPTPPEKKNPEANTPEANTKTSVFAAPPSETASPVARAPGNGGGVVSGGFADRVASGGGSSPQQAQKKPDLEPVEIVFKPRPMYTPEARRLRVEGEVLIEVVFTASGSLHINRVVKELGYGLDDAALAAAQRIRFHPARRDGQPYDCAALVHIVFELPQ